MPDLNSRPTRVSWLGSQAVLIQPNRPPQNGRPSEQVARDWPELAAKSVGLIAALLPVSVFVIRAISFQIGADNTWAVPVAWSASIAQLAFTGFWGIVPGLIAVGILAIDLFVTRNLGTLLARTFAPRRRFALVIGVLFPVSGIAVILFFPDYTGIIVGGLTAIPISIGSLRLRGPTRPPVSFGHFWPYITASMLIAAVATGVTLDSQPGFLRASYTFDTKVLPQAVDGDYQQLGDATDLSICRSADSDPSSPFVKMKSSL